MSRAPVNSRTRTMSTDFVVVDAGGEAGVVKASPSSSTAQQQRELWSSRSAFLCTAVGASVGFGNVWRFPSLVYQYGGGAFFLPYLSALLLVGLPLLIQEVCMGQHLRTGDVGVTGHFNKHLRGVGVASILSGMMVCTYYVPLISWCIRAFFESFGSMRDDWQNMEGSETTSYFFHNLIGTYTLDESRRPTRVVPLNVVYLALTWTLVGGCLAFGIKWTGRVAYVTVGLPVVMMFVLLVRALTLPGASDGIHAYIGDWDFGVLLEKPDIWSTAVSQIFFSMGVAVRKNQPVDLLLCCVCLCARLSFSASEHPLTHCTQQQQHVTAVVAPLSLSFSRGPHHHRAHTS